MKISLQGKIYRPRACECRPLDLPGILGGQRTDVDGDAADSPTQDATNYDCAGGIADVVGACTGQGLRWYQIGLDDAIRII